MEDIYKYAAISTHPNHKYIVYDKNPLCCKEDISEIRLASAEETKRLFKTIEDNGYCWDPKTKTLNPKFKDGDVVFYSNTIAIFKEWGDETLFRTYCTFYTTVSNSAYQFEISRPLNGKGIRREARFATLEEKEKLFEVIRDNGYRWNPETKTLNPEFKDGDIVVAGDDDAFQMFILKEVKVYQNDGYDGVCYFGWDFDDNTLFNGGFWGFNRLASEEEKERLFKTLNDNGYRWDAETRTLKRLPKFKVDDVIQYEDRYKYKVKITEVNIEDECYGYESIIAKGIGSIDFSKQDNWKLIPNKFDISTLVPFESRVLVRDVDHNEWEGAIFGRYDGKAFFTIGGLDWRYCIPYEGNEHLLGKTIDCDGFYKNWE